jgi:hypothetical protein
MSATVPVPEASPRFNPGEQISAMLNIFVDPRSAVKAIPGRLSWLLPLLVMGVTVAITQFLNVDTILRVMQQNPPGNMTAEQVERSLPMMATVQRAMAFVTPLMIALFLSISAGLIVAMSSVLDIRVRFRDMFSLMAYAGLITIVQVIAHFIVIRLKGDDIQSMMQLTRPAFGLDLLLSDGANKLLAGLLGYFSVFMVWHIVVAALAYSYFTGARKSTSFIATSPAWVVGLVFSLIGSIFAG